MVVNRFRLVIALFLPALLLVLVGQRVLSLGCLNMGSIALSRALSADKASSFRLTQLDRSEGWLRLAENLQGGKARVYRARGMVYYERGEYELAREAFEESLSRDPVDRQTRSALAFAYHSLGMLQEAEREWRRARVLEFMLDCVITEGAMLARAGDLASAETAYQRAVEIAPSSPRGYYAMAGFYWGRDQDRCEWALTKALELDSGSQSFDRYWAEGRLAMLHRDWGYAITALQLSVSMRPSHLWSRVLLADALRWDGQTANAISEYHKALELDPNCSYARQQMEESLAPSN